MATMELSPAVMRRVNKIAKEYGRTVEEVMPFILKDGLDDTEEQLEFLRKSEDDEKAGRMVTVEEFEANCRKVLGNAKHKKAA